MVINMYYNSYKFKLNLLIEKSKREGKLKRVGVGGSPIVKLR